MLCISCSHPSFCAIRGTDNRQMHIFSVKKTSQQNACGAALIRAPFCFKISIFRKLSSKKRFIRIIFSRELRRIFNFKPYFSYSFTKPGLFTEKAFATWTYKTCNKSCKHSLLPFVHKRTFIK